MKRVQYLIISLFVLCLTNKAEAQNHNSPAGKGLNGQQPLGVYTDGATAVNDNIGAWGRYAVSENGAMYCSGVDGTSGLTQSVVPVSTSGNIGGPGVLLHSLAWKAADAAEAGSTVTSINATGHSAAVNNYIYLYTSYCFAVWQLPTITAQIASKNLVVLIIRECLKLMECPLLQDQTVLIYMTM